MRTYREFFSVLTKGKVIRQGSSRLTDVPPKDFVTVTYNVNRSIETVAQQAFHVAVRDF